MEIQKLYVTLGLDSSGFKTGMAAMTGVVAAGAIAASAAIAAVAIDGVKAAADMESQMSGIAAIFSTTVDEIQPLGDLIKDLGLNPNLKVNATEAADAIEMLGKNGLTMAEIMDGAAESTVLLANSTGADFAVAANIGTDAMALWNIEAKDMTTAVDGITAVTVNSKFGINDYALALAQGGGVASSVGVTFSDFNATIAGISPLFKSGSDAGTSLKTMLLRLNPATDAAAEAMDELGLLTEEGGSAFFDATGKMLPMAEVAGLMDSAFGDLSDAQRISTMQTIFGTDAMRAAVGMMDLGEEGFRELTDTMGQTDAMAAAATRMDNLSGAMEIFEGIMDTVKLTFGQALLPVIRIFVDWLIVLADGVMPKIEKAFSKLAAFLPALTKTLGKLNKVGFKALFTTFEDGSTYLDDLFELFGLTEKAAQALTVPITKLIKRMVEFLKPITKAIKAFVSWEDILIVVGIAIAATLVPILISLLGTILSIVAPILALIAAVALLRKAWDALGIDTDVVSNKASAFVDMLQNIFGPVLERIKESILGLQDNMRPLMPLFADLGAAVQRAWVLIKPALEALGLVAAAVAVAILDLWGNQLAAMFNALPGIIGGVVKIITGIIDGFVSLFSGAIEAIKLLIEGDFIGAFEAAKEGVQGWVEGTVLALSGVVDIIGELFQIIYDTVVNTVNDLTGSTIASFEEMKGSVLAAAQPIVDFFAKVKEFGTWLATNVFSFKIDLPELPDWAIPGSPLPIHTAWSAFLNFLNSASFDIDIGLGLNGKTISADEIAKTVTNMALAIVAVAKSIEPAIRAINNIMGVTFASEARFQLQMNELKQQVNILVTEFARIGWTLTRGNIGMAKDMVKAVVAITDAISGIIAGLQLIAKETIPQGLGDKFQALVSEAHFLALIFSVAAATMEEEAFPQIIAYIAAATAVFGLVELAIKSMQFLTDVDMDAILKDGFHLRDQMVVFRNIVRSTMREFDIAAREINAEMSDAVSALAKAAGDVFGIIELVIENAAFLSDTDFGAILKDGYHLHNQTIILRNIIRDTIRQFAIAAEELGTEGLDAISAFISVAGEAFALVGDAIEVLGKIGDYVGFGGYIAAVEGINTFIRDFNLFVEHFIRSMWFIVFKVGSLLEAVHEFGPMLESVLSGVTTAIDALTAIGDYVGLGSYSDAVAKINTFIRDFNIFTEHFVRAMWFIVFKVGSLIEATHEAAQQLQTVLGVVVPAIDALRAIGDRVGFASLADATAKVQVFQRDFIVFAESFIRAMWLIVFKVGSLITATEGFAVGIQGIIGLVEPAVSAIASIAEHVKLDNALQQMAAFEKDFIFLVDFVAEALFSITVMIGDILEDASLAAEKITAIVGVVAPAIDALASISEHVKLDNALQQMAAFERDFIFLVDFVAEALFAITVSIGDILEDASLAAGYVQTIIGVIGPAVDGLASIADFKKVKNLSKKMRTFSDQFSEATILLVDMLVDLSGSIDDTAVQAARTFAENIDVILDHVIGIFKSLDDLVNAEMPSGLKDIMKDMIDVLQTTVEPAAIVGMAIGDAIVNGIIQAITTGITGVNAAIADLIGGIEFAPPQFPQPAIASGSGTRGSGSLVGVGRSVIVESGAFPITISDEMDAQEFEFRMLEILRRLTEG